MYTINLLLPKNMLEIILLNQWFLFYNLLDVSTKTIINWNTGTLVYHLVELCP